MGFSQLVLGRPFSSTASEDVTFSVPAGTLIQAEHISPTGGVCSPLHQTVPPTPYTPQLQTGVPLVLRMFHMVRGSEILKWTANHCVTDARKQKTAQHWQESNTATPMLT